MRKPTNYWTKEKVFEEALKYQHRIDFKCSKESYGAYQKAQKMGWLDEVCLHMEYLIKPSKYWTKERIFNEALKYNSRSEFNIKSCTAYKKAIKNGWLGEACSDMIKKATLRKRYIYSFEFSDNHVYVGLSYNPIDRSRIHLGISSEIKKCNQSAVFKYIEKTKIIPDFKILTDEPIDESIAGNIEVFFIEKYKKNGWILLNRIKGGGLGMILGKWTKEKVFEEALRYNSRKEFYKTSGAYQKAQKMGWLDEACSHMKYGKTQNNYWTKKRVFEEAHKYEYRKEFSKKSSGAYGAAYLNGWLDEVCSHMKFKIKSSNYWTKERVFEEAHKYEYRNEFKSKSSGGYQKAQRMGWLDDACIHMKFKLNQKNYAK